MKNKIKIVVVAVMLVAVALSLSIFSLGGDNSHSSEVVVPKYDLTDQSVTVYSDSDTAAKIVDYLSQYSSEIVCLDDITAEADGKIIFFDEQWIYENDTLLVDKIILDNIKKGIPVIFLGENHYLFFDSSIELTGYGYSDSSIVYGMFVYEGIDFHYGAGGDDQGSAVVLMYGWASELVSGKDPFEVTSTFSWMNKI